MLAAGSELALRFLDPSVTPDLNATQFGDQQFQLFDLAVARHDQFVSLLRF